MKWLLGIAGFSLVMPVIVLAQAQVPPENLEGMLAHISKLATAVGNGDWKVIGGGVLMLLMVIVRQFVLPKAKINVDHLPFIMALVSGLGFAGLAMVNDGVDLGPALKSALVTSGVAMMLWELGGKFLMKLLLGDAYVDQAKIEDAKLKA